MERSADFVCLETDEHFPIKQDTMKQNKEQVMSKLNLEKIR